MNHIDQASGVSSSKRNSHGPISVKELKQILKDTVVWGKAAPVTSSCLLINQVCQPTDYYNEVYPGIILGDWHLAKDIDGLISNQVTHVLNAAQGKKINQVDTDASFYSDVNIEFLGINAMDVVGFKLKDYFPQTTDFIDKCLRSEGRVYVHCYQGYSRSAAIVMAYLMMRCDMKVRDAAVTVATRRCVLPNDGFLRQLCELNEELYPKQDNQKPPIDRWTRDGDEIKALESD